MNELKDIIYNCRKATFLIEKKQLTALTFKERVELRIHLTGCSFCRLFQKQSIGINKMVYELFHSAADREIRLDDDYKKKLQERIEEKLNEN
ncbi:hypothetical protein HDE69_002713 [Pedobacter cryoconitis]|uniref:Zinc-finger domain-containing protein n=1 Tax=Pedobacter cryoconitis TaxID=188932 RepID=A0A7W8YTT0_9SPHI|nr:hypothetical protein [Pedobacter cryoconitis]MBB5621650.1 hypothetical protein [Pedobacter cryoconitis]MBB5644224.1 hypothetical protein [Pedobacter cryoconitis]